MVKDINDLKDFIQWAKDNKVKRIKMKGVEIELSDLAFIDSIGVQAPSNAKDNNLSQNTQEENEEDLLFYSSQSS